MKTEKKSPYIDIQKFRSEIESVLLEAVNSWDETAGEYVRYMKDSADEYMPEYIDGIIDDTIRSFDTYVHGNDTSLFGNFADIHFDYEREHKGKSFRKLIEDIDSGIEDADTREFGEWTIEWYFAAFGTYNLQYKWTNFMEEASADNED